MRSKTMEMLPTWLPAVSALSQLLLEKPEGNQRDRRGSIFSPYMSSRPSRVCSCSHPRVSLQSSLELFCFFSKSLKNSNSLTLPSCPLPLFPRFPYKMKEPRGWFVHHWFMNFFSSSAQSCRGNVQVCVPSCRRRLIAGGKVRGGEWQRGECAAMPVVIRTVAVAV